MVAIELFLYGEGFGNLVAPGLEFRRVGFMAEDVLPYSRDLESRGQRLCSVEHWLSLNLCSQDLGVGGRTFCAQLSSASWPSWMISVKTS